MTTSAADDTTTMREDVNPILCVFSRLCCKAPGTGSEKKDDGEWVEPVRARARPRGRGKKRRTRTTLSATGGEKDLRALSKLVLKTDREQVTEPIQAPVA
eukprot:CAMPEP_0172548330 /NCGR_PEP_ID=MMETSP1067-20121228/17647_1 /TAXON_ID=265564 ORGANISM="Thalassiosira punctigera, Strain Tpunct2005C2" /NCGR_SAMPLE_ID=MMETSP1067 /ASSEMBLY_ACC=CAM_ASM_000444 /LENGTH=99 /DNA_ID=CAMNT_0013335533 /DNA_START=10 /DNA_END=305 /DNA_ORIENTATION=+